MTRKNLDIQPIIAIRLDYNFNVTVTKNLIASAWQSHFMMTLP